MRTTCHRFILTILLINTEITMAEDSSHHNGVTFHVSTLGSDAWSGRSASPKTDKSDGPFATLERARDAIRGLKQKGKLPNGGVTVSVRAGTYVRSQSFQLTEQDSGTPDAPIVYRASE